MAKLFKLKVSSPAGILFEDEVLQVEIKTKTGYMALLADHTPIISSFLPSICYIRDLKNNRISSIINEGIFQFKSNTLTIFTNFFSFTDKINPNIFDEMQQQIDKAIKSKSYNDEKIFEDLQFKLQENINKLKKLVDK